MAVRMSAPRYIYMESAETISPPNWEARDSDNFVFPVAVVPIMYTDRSRGGAIEGGGAMNCCFSCDCLSIGCFSCCDVRSMEAAAARIENT